MNLSTGELYVRKCLPFYISCTFMHFVLFVKQKTKFESTDLKKINVDVGVHVANDLEV